MENKKILLPNKKYIGSPDSDIQFRVDFENKVKNSIEGKYTYTINSNEQYVTERQTSNLFRTYLKVNGLYYSNGLNNPLISNYDREYNTNYYINKQNTINPNDTKNFTVAINSNKTLSNLSSHQKIPFDVILKDSSGGFNILTNDFTIQESGIYEFGFRLGKLDVKNTDTSNHNYNLNINIKKNLGDLIFRQQIFNSTLNAGITQTLTPNFITSAITLTSSDVIYAEIEDLGANGIYLEPKIFSNVGLKFFVNSFYGTAKGINSFDKYLSNVDFLYDTVKTVTNITTATTNSKSVIFSLSAPYDDIIITNISPLTNITNERTIELLDYWYLPTDIKRNGSYVLDGYTNNAGDPVIVSATTGWINIGTFLTGKTETDFSGSNILRTPLFPFRGDMNIKIPKYKTYSFFVTVNNGANMTNNELLKTSHGQDSIAGFMGLPETMATGDTKPIKDYQQYCWLNIWPDSYELTGKTANVSLRDYYGWSNNNKWSALRGDEPYRFNPENMISGTTEPFAFKGIVNYKIVQKEPYVYRTEKQISYNDYYDSLVPSKQYLEYVNNDETNWDVFSMYPYERENDINLYISESGITHTFKISNGIPAKYNGGLTDFEISASTNTVFNSYFNHNLNLGEYVKVYNVSGSTAEDLGFFPVISIGETNNDVTNKLFTIKITGLTSNYIQIKRCLDLFDGGSMSQYYIRKYKIIENSDNYTITTPLSKNGFGNNNHYLTNKSQIDVNELFDENNVPLTNISYFFKKKDNTYTENQKITKIKNTFYDDYLRGRNGFISNEILTNNTNYFISGVSIHNTIDYGLGLMESGLTNTYRSGSITPDGFVLSDDVFIFEGEINVGSHIEFTDMYPTYSGLTALTQSVVYRKGDDFKYNDKKYFSLFSQYLKKPISQTSGDTFTLLGIKPTLNNFIGGKIAGSTIYPNYSMIYINNNFSDFPIGKTVFYSTASTDTLTSATIVNYELGGQYATIDSNKYSGVLTTGATSLYTLQYYGDTYNVKISDLSYEHYVVYHLNDYETKIPISDTSNIGDTIYGDIVEYNERELNKYVLQMPNYLFKVKDLYGYSGSTVLSATTSTYAKTDLLHPVVLKFLTNTIYRTPNVEDKSSWAVFNDNLNVWQWRDLIPNGEIDESGRGSDFPFLNGRHYVYNEIILPFRSKYWNPVSGNIRSISYNENYNYNNSVGTSQSINDIEIC